MTRAKILLRSINESKLILHQLLKTIIIYLNGFDKSIITLYMYSHLKSAFNNFPCFKWYTQNVSRMCNYPVTKLETKVCLIQTTFQTFQMIQYNIQISKIIRLKRQNWATSLKGETRNWIIFHMKHFALMNPIYI